LESSDYVCLGQPQAVKVRLCPCNMIAIGNMG
jgi:hypothetical protein